MRIAGLILCASLVVASSSFAQEGITPSVIVDAVDFFTQDRPRIAPGQIVTLRMRGLSAVASGPIVLDQEPKYEIAGVSVSLQIAGLKYPLPILGLRRDTMAMAAKSMGVVVQIPDVPQGAIDRSRRESLFLPRITVTENGVPGLPTYFEWRDALPIRLSYCSIILPLSATFGCGVWMTRPDGTDFGRPPFQVRPGDEVVLRLSGLGKTDPPTPTGQLFADPPPKVVTPLYVFFADPLYRIGLERLFLKRDESWIRIEPRPVPGQLGIYEVQIRIPDQLPYDSPVPASGCLDLMIYVSPEFAEPPPVPVIVCVTQPQ